MKKLLISLVCAVSMTSVFAQDANQEITKNTELNDANLLEQLFNATYFECRTFPDCDIPEGERMNRDSEMESSPYQTPSEKIKLDQNK